MGGRELGRAGARMGALGTSIIIRNFQLRRTPSSTHGTVPSRTSFHLSLFVRPAAATRAGHVEVQKEGAPEYWQSELVSAALYAKGSSQPLACVDSHSAIG